MEAGRQAKPPAAITRLPQRRRLLKAYAVRVGRARGSVQNALVHPPYHLSIASEVLGGAGDYESAAAALAEAEMAIDASNERWWEAEIHRLKGVLLLSQGDIAQSESCFKRHHRLRFLTFPMRASRPAACGRT